MDDDTKIKISSKALHKFSSNQAFSKNLLESATAKTHKRQQARDLNISSTKSTYKFQKITKTPERSDSTKTLLDKHEIKDNHLNQTLKFSLKPRYKIPPELKLKELLKNTSYVKPRYDKVLQSSRSKLRISPKTRREI